jgi:hypothetical protein
MKSPHFNSIILLFLVLFAATTVKSQVALPISTLDSIYTENFNSLSGSENSDVTVLEGVKLILENIDQNVVATNPDNNDTSGVFVYGIDNEWAVGGRASSGNDIKLTWILRNSTNTNITEIGVYYTGEQWYGGNSKTQTLDFKIGQGSDSSNITLVDYALDFNNPKSCNSSIITGNCTSARGSLDGNVAANRSDYQAVILLSDTLKPGDYVELSWEDSNTKTAAESHGLAIDDLGVVFFNDSATNWYLLNGTTEFSQPQSWTRWPNLLASTLQPDCIFPNDCFDSNVNFIVNQVVTPFRDLNLTGDNVQLIANNILTITESVTVTGNNSRIVVDENARLNVDQFSNAEFTTKLTLKSGAYMEYNSYNVKSFSFDSLFDQSTVYFNSNNIFNGIQNVPSASYYDLHIGDEDGGREKTLQLDGAISIRNSFTFDPDGDNVTSNYPVTFTGNSGVISTPNYNASGIFEEIIIADGASITFGALFNNAQYQDGFEHNNKLTIESGGTLSLSEDQTLRLTTTAEFSHDGVLNIPNNASLIIADGKTVSGAGITNITRAQSATPSASVFNHWSSPVSTASIGSGEAVNGSRNYSYENGEDDNSDYTKLTSTTAMTVGKGYSAFGNLTSTFVANGPSEINFGDITYTASELEDGDSDDENYYLVGNPYASGLSAFDFINDNSSEIKGTIYLFSQVNTFGSYSRTADNIAVNLFGSSDLGPAATGNASVDDFSDFSIASGQGFFVIDATPEVPGISIDFTESMQTGVNDDFKSGGNSRAEIKSRYWLTINNQTNYKSTLVGFASDATLGFDNLYDAPKVPSEVSLDIWSYLKNDRYEIQGLPENIIATQRIPLGVTVPDVGSYEINIAASDGVNQKPIVLLDSKEGVHHNLRNGSYSFLAEETGQILNRFFLVVQGQGNPVEVSELNARNNDCLASITKEAIAKAFEDNTVKRIEVYTLSGQMQFGWEAHTFQPSNFNQLDKACVFKIQMKNFKVCTKKRLQ